MVVVLLSTTLGWRQTNSELVSALRQLGRTVEVVDVDPTQWRARFGRLGWTSPFLDLAEAAASRQYLSAALRQVSCHHIVFASSTTVLLQPIGRRRSGVLRFDALARTNRPGLRNWPLKGLEEITLRTVKGLWPMTPCRLPGAARRASVHVLPPVVRSVKVPGPKVEGQAFCYVNGPKKRLEVILSAWARRAGEPGRLVVAGLTRDQGLSLLPRGFQVPHDVEWAGPLDGPQFRTLASESELFVAAPVFEDFGVAPLEALAAGCLLVTTPSPGHYIARGLVELVDSALVATEDSAPALARAITYAQHLSGQARSAAASNLVERVSTFSEPEFLRRLAVALTEL